MDGTLSLFLGSIDGVDGHRSDLIAALSILLTQINLINTWDLLKVI